MTMEADQKQLVRDAIVYNRTQDIIVALTAFSNPRGYCKKRLSGGEPQAMLAVHFAD